MNWAVWNLLRRALKRNHYTQPPLKAVVEPFDSMLTPEDGARILKELYGVNWEVRRNVDNSGWVYVMVGR